MTPSWPRWIGAIVLFVVLLLATTLAVACKRAAPQAGGGTGGLQRAPAPALTRASAADVLRAVREPGAGAVLVNVWATWCVPCREEFPDLLRVHRELGGRGLRLVLVSADFPDKADAARAFLADNGVNFPSFIKDGGDMEFIDALSPRWSGALPATFLYDGAGNLRDFWEGKADYDTFSTKAQKVLRERG